MARLRALSWCLAAILATASASRVARAGPTQPAAERPSPTSSVVLLPTAVADDADLRRLALSLDGLLHDTAQDLGLAVIPPPAGPARSSDRDLLDRARAAHAAVVLPSLHATSTGDVNLRLALAAPAGRAVDERRAQVSRAELPVRAVVLLRDLVAARARLAGGPKAEKPEAVTASTSIFRSPGKLSLLANATLVGGLLGYSIQRGSGSEDPRLLYPLLAIGAGVGLGGSLVASGEWEVSLGDAWYFAAGAWWPSLAAHLIFEGRFAAHRPDSERWAFGLLGGGAGVTIAGLGLGLGAMSEGGAVMTHSGGGLGLALGALLEIGARGKLHEVPYAGMGYGAGLGWLVAAAVATQVKATPLGVLAADIGAVGGGLLGAGLASPLLVANSNTTKQRVWAGIAAGSALAGFVAAVVVVHPRGRPNRVTGQPMIGVLGESCAGATRAPIYGVGYLGSLE